MTLFQLLFGDWLRFLFDFGGRINRAKYWLTFLIYFGFLICFYILAVVFAAAINAPELASLLVILALIPIVMSSVAVAIKRLHDRNKSGWWLLLFYGLPGALAALAPYTGIERASQLASSALSVWALIELGLLSGTSGRNVYGPDPLATKDSRREYGRGDARPPRR